jgi:ribonuclease P/MRP protein subunit RPP1
MPYHDLNLPYDSSTPTTQRSHILSFTSELGYSVIALSIHIRDKLPAKLPAIALSDVPNPNNLKLVTRLTLNLVDNTNNHRIIQLSSTYDLLALRPTDEKTFQLACLSLECDIISLDLSQRLDFILKFSNVSAALKRGIRFEICYSPGISGGTDARRNLISGATAIIRATRGRGIILSSEARDVLGLRAPNDIMNLVQVWGLGQERGKEAVCEEAARVVKLAALKRESYRGVVKIVDGGRPGPVESAQAVGEEGKEMKVSKATATGLSSQANGANGIKRTASAASLNPLTATTNEDKPLSKKEQKRHAKKARLEAQNKHKQGQQANSKAKAKDLDDNSTMSFPIKHESLLSASTTKKS